MTRYHLLGSTFVLLAAIASGACKSEGAGGSGGTGEPTGGSGGGAGGSTGGAGGNTGGNGGNGGSTGGGGGGTGGAPNAAACPEPNLFSPTLPNTVRIDDAVFLQDQTWTADKIYAVTGSLDIDGTTLTIEAGTTVCFATGAQLTVGATKASAIYIKGTSNKHVTFTWGNSFGDGSTDFWAGLVLNGWGDSKVSYLDIYYAGKGGGTGGWGFSMPSTAGGDDPNAPLLLDHLNVAAVQSRGIEIGAPVGVAPGSTITFGGYATPDPNGPMLGPAMRVNVYASNTLSDPNVTLDLDVAKIPQQSRFILIDHLGTMDSSVTWNDLGMPYRLPDGLAVFGDYTQNKVVDLTINAGVTVLMEGSLIIGNPQFQQVPDIGNLIVKGTAQKPVVFTSAQASPKAGDWGSLFFIEESFDPAVSSIDHAELSYGGDVFPDNTLASCTDGGNSGAGLIGIDGYHMFDGPSITNSSFSHSAGDGIRTHFAPKSITGDVINQNYGDASYGNTFDSASIAGLPFLDPTDPNADMCF